MNALYSMPDDVDLLREAIVAMEEAADKAKAAGKLKDVEKWEARAAAARKELAGLLPPRMGG